MKEIMIVFVKRIISNRIIETIISVHMADDFIVVMTDVIKRLAVDTLHIIGDIYDRGSKT